MSRCAGSVAISLVVLTASVAGAQTAPPGAPGDGRGTKRQAAPSPISGTQLAEQTAAMMKRTGGSLLQAQQMVETASGAATSTSYLNVPEPTPRTAEEA